MVVINKIILGYTGKVFELIYDTKACLYSQTGGRRISRHSISD